MFNRHIIKLNLLAIKLGWWVLMIKNHVKDIRESLLMSKAELARKAGVSPLTIDRIERGASCRMATMRKIILALGLNVSDRDRVFPE
jgi:DNA-binding XRE family transcriptional regulator